MVEITVPVRRTGIAGWDQEIIVNRSYLADRQYDGRDEPQEASRWEFVRVRRRR
jgi:hypothetical protein